ncbi:MAG: hypothetical protein JW891_09895 [Candidatus Lokiarchaeota archaeon]|nr:hypothetical protein [Candidatus Lokiarchaeota archaeon]
MENNSMFEAKIQLLFSLIGNGYLKDRRLFRAFLDENIEDFISEEYIYHAGYFVDRPSLFYHKNVDNYRTISAPHMICIMLQGLLFTRPDEDLLILGAKSGFISALAHKLIPEGNITVVEANSDVAKITLENLNKLNYTEKIRILVKNPLEGVPDQKPWKKILVTGAITEDKIYPLLEQLDPDGGVLFAPIGNIEQTQTYTQILRVGDDFFGKKQLQVQFSPLMTKVELDELELVMDFDEEIIEDQNKEDGKPSHISIKYTSSILDEIDLKPNAKMNPPNLIIQPIDVGIVFLEYIDDITERMKKSEQVREIASNIENIGILISIIENFKDKLNISFEQIASSFNHIKIPGTNSDFKDQPRVSNFTLETNKTILSSLNQFQQVIRKEVNKLKS